MNPFNQALKIIQEIQLKQSTTNFLNKDIIDAVKNGDLEKIKTFSKEHLNGSSNLYMGSGRPLIFDALYGFRSSEVLKLMIDMGTEVNCVDTGFPQRSPLMQAVKSGTFEQIKILVEGGADLNFTGNLNDVYFPQSIIGTALFYKRFEIVNYLEEHGGVYIKNEKKNILEYIN